MKVKFPEPIGPEVLYERSMQFNDLHIQELKDLLYGLETALDIVYKNKLKTREFSIVEYKIIFYRGDFENYDFIGNDFMSGGINLSAKAGRKFSLPKFGKEYKKLFRKVKDDFSKRPGSLNLEALIVGYRNRVTHEIEAFDPFKK